MGTQNMKLATIFYLFSTIRAAALITDDIGSGASVEALASETLDLLESTETTKDNKIVNFRDNVMKVLHRISDLQHCRKIIQKRLQPKGELTLDALATEMCFVDDWMDRIAARCQETNKCFDWKYKKNIDL